MNNKSSPADASRSAKPSSPLGYGDYLRFSKLVEERFGLHFSEQRRVELERGVQQAFANSTCADLEECYRQLLDPEKGALELDRLANALTVGETYFFRDAGQFNALYRHVLPQIINSRRAIRTLRIWSAGCASGEEPYSIAMMLRELLPDVEKWAITILGTDINTEALDRAHKAVYDEWAFREERAQQWRARYFRPQGKRYELVPEVRRMVTFARLNLAEADYPSSKTNTTLMDLILCRNVTIYFSQAITSQVIQRLYNALVDGGWLVVGHSEPSPSTYQHFQAHTFPNAILYQCTDEPQTRLPDLGELAGQAQSQKVVPRQAPSSMSSPAPASATIQPVPRSPSILQTEPIRDENPIERAQELLDYGHSEKARDLLLKMIAQEPRHALACSLLCQAYANLGRWTEAAHWCRQAVSFDKLALNAYYTLALVLQHQGQIDKAIEAMKKVVYIDRNYVLGHFGLAALYRNKSQRVQALKSLDNAQRLLAARDANEVIPDSGGITVGRLRKTIIRQRQQWDIGMTRET